MYVPDVHFFESDLLFLPQFTPRNKTTRWLLESTARLCAIWIFAGRKMALMKVVHHFFPLYMFPFTASQGILILCIPMFALTLSTCDLAETSTALRKTKSQIFTNSAVSLCFYLFLSYIPCSYLLL